MSDEVVVDANVAIKRVVPEILSDKARALFLTWEQTAVVLCAPAFFIAEVDSILRQKVVRKELTAEQAQESWEHLQTIPVVLADMRPLRRRAWEIAIALGHAHVYDAVYLALAETRGCELWTADERLVNAARNQFPFIQSLEKFRS